MQSTMTANRPKSTPMPEAFAPPSDASSIWDALTDDASVAVLVLDVTGTIEYVNQAALGFLALGSVDQVLGRSAQEIFSAEVVEERLSLVRERVMAGQAVTIDGMCRGRLLRSTFRLLAGSPSRVMVVSRLAAPSDPLGTKAEAGVVRAQVDDEGDLGRLTGREMEILKLIGLGLSSAEIARRLGRSVKTIEWHRVSLGDKLGVTNRVELARIAIAHGLVAADGPRSPEN